MSVRSTSPAQRREVLWEAMTVGNVNLDGVLSDALGPVAAVVEEIVAAERAAIEGLRVELTRLLAIPEPPEQDYDGTPDGNRDWGEWFGRHHLARDLLATLEGRKPAVGDGLAEPSGYPGGAREGEQVSPG